MLKARKKKLRQTELSDKLAVQLQKLDHYDTVETGLKGIRELMNNYPKEEDFKLILGRLARIIDNVHIGLFNKENVVILLGFLASNYQSICLKFFPKIFRIIKKSFNHGRVSL
jgi:hypothetical protein